MKIVTSELQAIPVCRIYSILHACRIYTVYMHYMLYTRVLDVNSLSIIQNIASVLLQIYNSSLSNNLLLPATMGTCIMYNV